LFIRKVIVAVDGSNLPVARAFRQSTNQPGSKIWCRIDCITRYRPKRDSQLEIVSLTLLIPSSVQFNSKT